VNFKQNLYPKHSFIWFVLCSCQCNVANVQRFVLLTLLDIRSTYTLDRKKRTRLYLT